MALLIAAPYGSDYSFKTGDDAFDNDNKEELQYSKEELLRAINVEGLTDKLFKRCMKERSRKHEALIAALKGDKD